MNPFEDPRHERYVEDGGCSAIHVSKAWCNLTRYHVGKHYAPVLRQNNSESGLFWGNDRGSNYTKMG